MKRKNPIALLISWIVFGVVPAHVATSADGGAAGIPSAAPGTITGRIFNPATREYIRNAEVRIEGTTLVALSEEGGYYRLINVPPGEATVVALYPGYEAVRTTVHVGAGPVTRDFELSPMGMRRNADETIKLGAFVVSTERAGQAKAVAEQKNAMNVKTVVASDNFGDIFEGNVGEFLKFMPGITLDYVETDTRAARLGGLEAQYGYVTLDGGTMASTNSLANGFRDSARAMEFEAISINNIESIEVNKTLSADMPADAPAGTVNLRTKSALDRKGMRFTYSVAMIGNQYELTLRKTPRPDDARHRKIRPTATFDYSNAFFGNKLGLAINGSATNVFKEQFRITNVYDYTSAQVLAAGGPQVNTITYKDGPKMTEKSSGGLKLDYQPFQSLRLSLASSYTYFVDEMSNRTVQFRGVGNLGAGSTMTRLVALPSGANANTRIAGGAKYSSKKTDTTNLSLGFTYKLARLTADGLASFSRARFQNGAEHRGTVDSANVQMTRIGFIAERSSVDSPSWSFTQTSGANWSDLNNWGRNDLQPGNIDSQNSVAKTEQYVAQLNVKYAMNWSLPTFFKAGLYEQVTARSRHYNQFLYTLTYVGPAGNQLNAPMPVSSADVRIAQAWGSNLWSLPFPDRKAVRDLVTNHPTYFTATPAMRASDLDIMLGNPQSNQEQIGAAYVMQNTRIGPWQIQGGLRAEDTRTISSVKAIVPVRLNPYANVTTNATTGVRTYSAATTLDYINYKWSKGFAADYGAYRDFLPSLSAKYTIRPDLNLKLGYNKAIKRPRLDYIAGQWLINGADTLITIPNPDLGPERSSKYSAMMEYYFEPAGTVGVHVFQTEIRGTNDQLGPLPAAAVGYGDDPIYGQYEFITFENVPGIRRIRGIELNYSQQLTFLPTEFLKGINIFATYSRYASHSRPANFVPQNATGGITWRYRRVSASIAGTWVDESRTDATGVPAASRFFTSEPEYIKERYLFDVSGGYQISQHTSLFISGRDVFDSGRTWYYKADNRMRQREQFGCQWTVGVKGNF